MVAVLYAFGFAFLLFGLASEVQTEWLRILGFVAGSYMALAGAVAGWRRFRNE